MGGDEVEKLCQYSYQRGYKEGFEDACKQFDKFLGKASKYLSEIAKHLFERSDNVTN